MKRTSRLLRNRAAQWRGLGPAPQPARAEPRRAPPAAQPPAAGQAHLGDALGPPAGPVALSRAKGQWLVGDWQALAALSDAELALHPERDRLALLVACAHLQLDQPEQARGRLRQALQWGCHPGLAARLLISGVHNSFGRLAALKGSEAQIERHFGQALAVTDDPESSTAAHTRAIREMAQLGLLPQAAGLLGEQVARLGGPQRPAALSAQVTMLRSEVELLQVQLALALQNQPGALAPGGAAGPVAARAGTAGDVAASPADSLRAGSVSQLGQDLWVLERSGYKRGGYFVEFGATDGVLLSNSFLLEKRMGWRGICCEPNPRYLQRLRQNRQCIVSDACIGPTSGERVEFVLAEEFGSLASDMAHDLHAERRQAYWADTANRAVFETVSLHDLLTRHGAPHDIDYLSIDTEGSEYAILAAFPFERWNIRLITVEHNYTPAREQIRALLEPLGYRRTEAKWDDWYERTTAAAPAP